MPYRKLRIACSVAWGVVAVLLCVRWVRSYYIAEVISGTSSNNWLYNLSSDRGTLNVNGGTPANLVIPWNKWAFTPDTPALAEARKRSWIWKRFDLEQSVDRFNVTVPHWFAVFTLGTVATAAWLPWRFSLRTPLIATTLVAVALGLIVWLR